MNVDNLAFAEEVFQLYQTSPEQVDPEWRSYFEELGLNGVRYPDGPSFRSSSIFNPPTQAPLVADAFKQERVDQLIRAYRVRGHRIAHLDPLGQQPEDLRPRPRGRASADAAGADGQHAA